MGFVCVCVANSIQDKAYIVKYKFKIDHKITNLVNEMINIYILFNKMLDNCSGCVYMLQFHVFRFVVTIIAHSAFA